MAMSVVDTLLAGRHGPLTLGGCGFGSAIWSLALLICVGMMMAIPPTVSQLNGAGNVAGKSGRSGGRLCGWPGNRPIAAFIHSLESATCWSGWDRCRGTGVRPASFCAPSVGVRRAWHCFSPAVTSAKAVVDQADAGVRRGGLGLADTGRLCAAVRVRPDSRARRRRPWLCHGHGDVAGISRLCRLSALFPAFPGSGAVVPLRMAEFWPIRRCCCWVFRWASPF